MQDRHLVDGVVSSFRQRAPSLKGLVEKRFVFSGLDRVPATAVAPESYKVRFEGGEVAVEIILYPLPDEQGVVLVYVHNLKNGQVLNLKDWLVKHGRMARKDAFKLGSYGRDGDERVEGFFKFLSQVFVQKEMSAILSGSDWEDIPFDWTGIK